MPDATVTKVMTFLNKAYFEYNNRYPAHYPNTIWVSRGLYNTYKDSLITLTRLTPADTMPITPSVEHLKYRSADVRPIELAGIFIVKTTRCTGRYNG